jgi:hypothetical protein
MSGYIKIPVTSGGGGVTDHSALTGLGNDDHTQYHNDTRGDARYYTKSQVDTSLGTKISKSVGPTYTTNEIITLTQAEYDAIGTPNATTLYFII